METYDDGDSIADYRFAERAIRRSQAQQSVLIAESSRLVAEALMFTLDSDPSLEAIGYGLAGWNVLDLVASYEPDVVLVGAGIPPEDQLQLTNWVHGFSPTTLLILLRERLIPEEVEALYAAGAADCLATTCSADELLHALTAARMRQLAFERGRRAAALRLIEPREQHG